MVQNSTILSVIHDVVNVFNEWIEKIHKAQEKMENIQKFLENIQNQPLIEIIESLQNYSQFVADLIGLGILDLESLSNINSFVEGNLNDTVAKIDLFFSHYFQFGSHSC